MSENPRASLSAHSSPRRSTQPISRPHWPWAAPNYSRRDSQSPLNSSSSQLNSTQNTTSWEQRASFTSGTTNTPAMTWRDLATQKAATSSAPSMAFSHGQSTRQWTLAGFEWAVKDAAKLRDFVEGVPQVDEQVPGTADDFELLKQSPMLGDNKFKLEIALTSPVDESARSFLSLYITSLFMDYAHGDFETSATMMAAIKCQDDILGERGARPEWVWEFWQHDWVFRQESEVWECPLPPLSDLLENARIRETDSFVICVQIHSPAGPTIPQQPSVYYVPKDLLDGLEASLDNPNTGDVRFTCLERLSSDGSTELTSSTSSLSRQSTASGSSPFSSHTTARKRVIYAHSDILVRRSEYFATMLSSSFSENTGLTPGERKIHTIVVEEADFETMYWLLKFCYANWLLFKQHDDPRAAVEGVGAGWSAKWLNSRENEWDWKTFHKSGPGDEGGIDSRSATSGDSIPLSISESRKSDDAEVGLTPTPPTHLSSIRASSSKATLTTTSRQTTSGPRRSTAAGAMSTTSANMNVGGSSSSGRKTVPVPISPSTYSGGTHYPVSPRAQRQHPAATPDPHPHPTPPPTPASALAMYQVAHRYAMRGLAALALEHIMSTTTPESCFPLLLASYTWDELHSLVEDYVIDKWEEVSVSAEFEICCKEVAAGEWGPDGGKTLMSVFRRLRSPNVVAA